MNQNLLQQIEEIKDKISNTIASLHCSKGSKERKLLQNQASYYRCKLKKLINKQKENKDD